MKKKHRSTFKTLGLVSGIAVVFGVLSLEARADFWHDLEDFSRDVRDVGAAIKFVGRAAQVPGDVIDSFASHASGTGW